MSPIDRKEIKSYVSEALHNIFYGFFSVVQKSFVGNLSLQVFQILL